MGKAGKKRRLRSCGAFLPIHPSHLNIPPGITFHFPRKPPPPPPLPLSSRALVELAQEFETLIARRRTPANYQTEVSDLFDTEFEEVEVGRQGRRFVLWEVLNNLEQDQTEPFMNKICEKVNTSFSLRYINCYKIRNISDDLMPVWYSASKGSPWLNKLEDARGWLADQENKRLIGGQIGTPTTGWAFDSHYRLDVRAVLDQQPLLGTGPLPTWLRNLAHSRAMFSLDTYRDNLCFWRCLAVHWGTRPDRSTNKARELAQIYFKLSTLPNDCPRTSLEDLEKIEKHFNHLRPSSEWLGIRVYEPARCGRKCGMVSPPEPNQPAENNDNWDIRGTHLSHSGHFQTCTRLRLCSL